MNAQDETHPQAVLRAIDDVREIIHDCTPAQFYFLRGVLDAIRSRTDFDMMLAPDFGGYYEDGHTAGWQI